MIPGWRSIREETRGIEPPRRQEAKTRQHDQEGKRPGDRSGDLIPNLFFPSAKLTPWRFNSSVSGNHPILGTYHDPSLQPVSYDGVSSMGRGRPGLRGNPARFRVPLKSRMRYFFDGRPEDRGREPGRPAERPTGCPPRGHPADRLRGRTSGAAAGPGEHRPKNRGRRANPEDGDFSGARSGRGPEMGATYRHPALKELKEQQSRYAPKEKLLEQINRAEKLLAEIEEEKRYPLRIPPVPDHRVPNRADLGPGARRRRGAVGPPAAGRGPLGGGRPDGRAGDRAGPDGRGGRAGATTSRPGPSPVGEARAWSPAGSPSPAGPRSASSSRA